MEKTKKITIRNITHINPHWKRPKSFRIQDGAYMKTIRPNATATISLELAKTMADKITPTTDLGKLKPEKIYYVEPKVYEDHFVLYCSPNKSTRTNVVKLKNKARSNDVQEPLKVKGVAGTDVKEQKETVTESCKPSEKEKLAAKLLSEIGVVVDPIKEVENAHYTVLQKYCDAIGVEYTKKQEIVEKLTDLLR